MFFLQMKILNYSSFKLGIHLMWLIIELISIQQQLTNCTPMLSLFHLHRVHTSLTQIPLMSKQMSHACDGYNDITAGVEELMRSYPGKKILLIGACVGGQCVVDYLASPHATQTPAVGPFCVFSTFLEKI